MARYVLLTFADNAEADGFVAAVESGRVFYTTPHPEQVGEFKYNEVRDFAVRAVWMKPTKFCECPKPGDRSARGAKWGLYVHQDCGKPKKGAWQHPRNLYSPVPSAAAQSEHLGVAEPANPVPGERDIYIGVMEPQPADGVTNAPVGAPYRQR